MGLPNFVHFRKIKFSMSFQLLLKAQLRGEASFSQVIVLVLLPSGVSARSESNARFATFVECQIGSAWSSQESLHSNPFLIEGLPTYRLPPRFRGARIDFRHIQLLGHWCDTEMR